ncbi:hypothetical protein DA73_0400027420 [Tolypothrix bouteillei VB521301]|uniref:Uncharacterized protein n=1 Tax=Tolypothrix bouteillei VB521301 TaxID=1479485 RepID=A0A8S9TH93_9CYAN|nr:hypothetical protein DA73_0400027420 [Tolypothrix bouteillei VB521301]
MQELQHFAFSQQGSMTILRMLGYGLLVLALFDIIEILIPPNFLNPGWEFQTIGTLVERVPVSLIGFVLVFFGELHSRTKLEISILKTLSWLTLLLGVIFILFIPLGIINTVRLNNQSVSQITTASNQQISRAEDLEKQLNQVTPDQIDKFLKIQGRSLDNKKPEEVKKQLLSQVSQAKQQIKNQAQSVQSLRGLNLIKSSAKWNLGALVAAVLFINIWKGTGWARR